MRKGLKKINDEMKKMIDEQTDEKKRKNLENNCEMMMRHFKKVCNEEYDRMLSRDCITFQDIMDKISAMAKEYAVNGIAIIGDKIVFSWIDEYVMKEAM